MQPCSPSATSTPPFSSSTYDFDRLAERLLRGGVVGRAVEGGESHGAEAGDGDGVGTELDLGEVRGQLGSTGAQDGRGGARDVRTWLLVCVSRLASGESVRRSPGNSLVRWRSASTCLLPPLCTLEREDRPVVQVSYCLRRQHASPGRQQCTSYLSAPQGSKALFRRDHAPSSNCISRCQGDRRGCRPLLAFGPLLPPATGI